MPRMRTIGKARGHAPVSLQAPFQGLDERRNAVGYCLQVQIFSRAFSRVCSLQPIASRIHNTAPIQRIIFAS